MIIPTENFSEEALQTALNHMRALYIRLFGRGPTLVEVRSMMRFLRPDISVTEVEQISDFYAELFKYDRT